MAIAYGQITIVDISDLGQLSVYPTSNQPYSVIYDPNASGDNQYNPNWSKNNLVLTPVIYYGNAQVTASNSIVKWYKDNSTTAISSGANADGTLTVTDKSILSPTGAKLVSYTCKVTYSPEGTGATLHAEGKITFSLIEQPTTVKSINITGSTLFLYNGNKELQSPATITLKANPQNCSITNWYYYKNGTKTTISQTNTTLDIAASNTTYFPSNTNSCTFGVQSNVNDIYDEITLVKVYDGAAGDSAVVAVLSNESQTISFNKDGSAVNGAYTDAYTVLTVYDGNDDVTDSCTITSTPDSSVTGSWDATAHKYTVTGITASGKVSFKIEYSDPTTKSKKTLYKTFSLVMTQPGADGNDAVSYSMGLSSLAVSKRISDDGTVSYSPDKITLNGYKKIGSNDREAYACRFTVIVDNGAETELNTSDATSSTYSTNKDFTTLVFKMYAGGGTNTPLDTQTVVQTSDGKKGATGADGVGGVITGLGNSSDQLACDNSGAPKAQQEFQIPFYALQGIAAVSVKATTSWSVPTNVAELTGLNSSVNGQGTLKLTIKKEAVLSNTTIIPITLTATVKDQDGTNKTVSATHNYSLTKSLQGDTGISAVTLQAYAQGGGVFVNSQGTETLKAILTTGTTTVDDASVSYKWAKWDGDSYEFIDNETSSSLTVEAQSVSSFASYKVVATYPKTNGKDYIAYVSVLDKSDPLQVYMFSTVGEKLVNSQGRGVAYARVYQNGQEIDSVEGWYFSATAPAQPATNAIWVDYSGSTIVIKKYTGSTWSNYTPTYSCDYNWTLTNSDNAQLSTSTSRFMLITSDVVSGKTNFNLTVNYPKGQN